MISGVVKPPSFDVNNCKIAKRHVYACAFAQFWRAHPTHFRTVGDFFLNDGPLLFRRFLDGRPKSLLHALKEVVPSAVQREIGVDDWSWVEEMYSADGVMTKTVNELDRDLATLDDALQEAVDHGQYSTAERLKLIRNTIVKKPLISYLSQRTSYPSTAFPLMW